MIVVGVGIFMYKDNKASSVSSMALGAGELLLVIMPFVPTVLTLVIINISDLIANNGRNDRCFSREDEKRV